MIALAATASGQKSKPVLYRIPALQSYVVQTVPAGLASIVRRLAHIRRGSRNRGKDALVQSRDITRGAPVRGQRRIHDFADFQRSPSPIDVEFD